MLCALIYLQFSVALAFILLSVPPSWLCYKLFSIFPLFPTKTVMRNEISSEDEFRCALGNVPGFASKSIVQKNTRNVLIRSNWQLDLMRLNEFYKWIRSLHSLRPHDVTDSDTTHFIDRIAVPTTTTTATAQCTEHNIVAFAKLLLAGGEPFSCELHYVATILRRWHNSHLAYYQLRRSCRHTMSHRSHYYRRPFYVLYANRSVQRTPLTRT